jgi:tetratricopeptide (TPR) repeat protein
MPRGDESASGNLVGQRRGPVWSELADAVWLTAATQYAWGRQRTASATPSREEEQPAAAYVHDPETAAEQVHPAVAPTPSNKDGDAGPSVDETETEEDTPAAAPRVMGLPLAPDTGWLPAARVTPRARSLAAEIIRALRPFKRRVPSPEQEELDEEATAERAVQDGLWLPETRPEMTRWLDLTVVVDTNPSMALWHGTVNTVITALERLGAFRSIHRRFLDSGRTPLLRSSSTGHPIRSPTELIDFSGRRIVLVLTDGVGVCWRQGSMLPILAKWGESMPVAVAHLLPRRLWRRGATRPERARLTAERPVTPKRQWKVHLPDAWLDPDPMPPDAVAVPILELQGRSWANWAQLVAGHQARPADAMVMLARPQLPQPLGDADQAEPPSPQQCVKNFLNTASPPACRLATLLAAVPPSVQVAQLILDKLIPDSGPDHLAEVFTSDLLRPVDDAIDSWESATFDFQPEIREILLSGARRADTAHTVRVVADGFADRLDIRHLRDALDDPDGTPISFENGQILDIERIVMRALSGPYRPRAARLDHPLDHGKHAQSGESGYPKITSTTTTPRSRMPTVSEPTSSQGVESTHGSVRSDSGPESPPLRVVGPGPERTGVPGDTGGGDGRGEPPSGPPSTVVAGMLRDRQPHDVPPIWGDIPPRNPLFTGRDEMMVELDRRTADSATAILPAALHGMGGIGKTQIAVEYIYRHLQDFDLVWWVQATHLSQLRAALTELAQALRLPGSSEAHTAVPAVREALRRGHPVRRWLLVFDSAESPEEVQPFFPTNGPGEILITSRNPDWAETARPLEVDLFERDESVELLRRRGPDITDEEATALAEKLGDLPLAIAQAATWRAETGMPVEEYLRLFDEKVAEILDSSAPNNYEVSLAAAWNVSFDQLESRNPAAHQLLQVCAFFAPEPIARSLFTGIRGTAISPELDAALRDPIRLGRAIRDINRYGLAKIDHRNSTLQLHRLVQAVLRDRMPPQRRVEMRHGAHLLLANLNPNDPITPAQWSRYQAILPHAYASGVLHCDDPWVRQMVLDLMEYLYRWGDHEECAALARQAIDVWSERLGETDPQRLQAADKLSFYLWALGQYAEAAAINQRILALRRQISGDNSEETLIAEGSVAADLRARGEFLAAREMNEQTYLKAKGLFGEDDPVTLNAAHNLAVSFRLCGDLLRARQLSEDTYRRQVEVRGYDSAPTINTFADLIVDRIELGDYAWAHGESERLVDRSRQMFGEDKVSTLRHHLLLSIAMRKNGDHRGALERSGWALDRFRHRYGHDHPQTLRCAIGHSIDLRHDGDLQAARALGEDTFERYRNNLGENHPHTLAAALDLAVTLRLSGEVAGARQLDERCAQQFRTIFGPDQIHTIFATINLANDLAELGELETALTLDSEVTERAERVLGADHPTTLAAGHNLVLDLRAVGRGQEAESAHADVLARYRRVLGDTHPAVMAAAKDIRANCDIDPVAL